jgi:hypothetical protein
MPPAPTLASTNPAPVSRVGAVISTDLIDVRFESRPGAAPTNSSATQMWEAAVVTPGGQAGTPTTTGSSYFTYSEGSGSPGLSDTGRITNASNYSPADFTGGSSMPASVKEVRQAAPEVSAVASTNSVSMTLARTSESDVWAGVAKPEAGSSVSRPWTDFLDPAPVDSKTGAWSTMAPDNGLPDWSVIGTLPDPGTRLAALYATQSADKPPSQTGNTGASGNSWLWVLAALLLGGGTLEGTRRMMSREPEAIWIEPSPPSPRQRERDIEQEVAQITYQRESQRTRDLIAFDTEREQQAAEQAQDISQHFDEYVEASVRNLQVEYQYLFQEWGSQEFTRGDLEWLRDQIAEKRRWTIEELNARLQSLQTDQADLEADIKLQQWNLYCAAKEFESLDDLKYDGPDVSDYLGEGDPYDPYIVSDQGNSWDGSDSWYQTDSWDQTDFWDQSDVLSGFNILNESDALGGLDILNEPDALSGFNILNEYDAMDAFSILYEPDAMSGFNILYEPDAMSGFNILNEPDAMSGFNILAEPDAMSGDNIRNEPDALDDIDWNALDPFSTGPDQEGGDSVSGGGTWPQPPEPGDPLAHAKGAASGYYWVLGGAKGSPPIDGWDQEYAEGFREGALQAYEYARRKAEFAENLDRLAQNLGFGGTRAPEPVFNGRQFEFRGKQITQRDGTFEPYRVDQDGLTNIQRMEKGLAPIGNDGKQVVIHHVGQKDAGPLVELTRTEHGSIPVSQAPSEINRSAADTWRISYWKWRANGSK